jgi:hypothetical protein
MQIRNPIYGDAARTCVVLEVLFPGAADYEVLVARPNDAPTAIYFQRALAGQYGPVGAYVPPPTPVPVVPASVTPRQARLALLQAGLLGSVEAALVGMPGDAGQAARIEWEYATVILRDSPLVAALTTSLGWDAAMLDALFTTAETL